MVSAYLPDKLKTRISDYNANAVDYKIITIGYSGKSEDPNNSIESQVKSVVGHRLVVSIRPDLNLGAPKETIIGTATHVLKRIKYYYEIQIAS